MTACHGPYGMTSNSPTRLAHPKLTAIFRRIAIIWTTLFEGLAWPYIELFFRLWLAKLFFGFGALQLMNWQRFLEVVGQENPVPFLSPEGAAYVSTAVYLLCPALLSIGFMTRYAALPLLGISLLAQLYHEPFDTQLFWIAVSGWFSVYGAGPLSLDNLLRRGLRDSAVPWVPAIIRASEWVRRRGTPVYACLLRIWLGLAMWTAAYDRMGHQHVEAVARWLPLDVAARIRLAAAFVGGTLLVLGAGTRYIASALLLCLVLVSAVDPRTTDSIYLLIILGILAIYGGGRLSLDGVLLRWRDRLLKESSAPGSHASLGLPRVVIVGAGFGGISCASALRDVAVAVTLVDRTNYHLFQPLLYQVATAALSPGDIATPARQIFKNSHSVRLLLGTVNGVDTERRIVRTNAGDLSYDYLVLATGASHSYFGKEAWAPFAPGLKRVEDALEIRRRILSAFERAEATLDPEERQANLTFLIVGGGPTGVELAGAIAELARYGMENEFRAFDPSHARVILVQSAPRLLPNFPESLAMQAQQALERLGVEVRLGGRVEDIDEHGVQVGGQRIPSRTVLWAAGVSASPAASWLNAPSDKAGRILVDENLCIPGFKEIFAIGDTAACNCWEGELVPGLAPAAKQGGSYVAKQIRAVIEARPPPTPFRYRHFGSLATIGRKAAVADFGRVRLWGAPAWWLWGMVHVGFMLSVRNRVATLVNWFWAYLRFGGSIRLITGG